jgi:hypothetical protein
MDGACSSHGRDDKRIQQFGRKTLSEETTRRTGAWVIYGIVIDFWGNSVGRCGPDASGSR